MTSGQDIRGIPVIETPDSDDDMPKKPQPRKSGMAPQRECARVCVCVYVRRVRMLGTGDLPALARRPP